MTQDPLMWDPIGYAGGMLNASELEACKRVLRALREPIGAPVVTSWPDEDKRAWGMLCRAGYAEVVPARPFRKLTAPFRWDKVRATPAGLRWLGQVECPN